MAEVSVCAARREWNRQTAGHRKHEIKLYVSHTYYLKMIGGQEILTTLIFI